MLNNNLFLVCSGYIKQYLDKKSIFPIEIITMIFFFYKEETYVALMKSHIVILYKNYLNHSLTLFFTETAQSGSENTDLNCIEHTIPIPINQEVQQVACSNTKIFLLCSEKSVDEKCLFEIDINNIKKKQRISHPMIDKVIKQIACMNHYLLILDQANTLFLLNVEEKNKPHYIFNEFQKSQSTIDSIFCGPAQAIFRTKEKEKEHELWAFGNNCLGQLGIFILQQASPIKKIDSFANSTVIKQITFTKNNTTILGEDNTNNEQKLFVSGKFNGIFPSEKVLQCNNAICKFTEVNFNFKIKKIASTAAHTIVLTTDDKFYVIDAGQLKNTLLEKRKFNINNNNIKLMGDNTLFTQLHFNINKREVIDIYCRYKHIIVLIKKDYEYQLWYFNLYKKNDNARFVKINTTRNNNNLDKRLNSELDVPLEPNNNPPNAINDHDSKTIISKQLFPVDQENQNDQNRQNNPLKNILCKIIILIILDVIGLVLGGYGLLKTGSVDLKGKNINSKLQIAGLCIMAISTILLVTTVYCLYENKHNSQHDARQPNAHSI